MSKPPENESPHRRPSPQRMGVRRGLGAQESVGTDVHLSTHPVQEGRVGAGPQEVKACFPAGEIIISPARGESTGMLAPACQLKIKRKTNELQLEFFQDPWRLVNIRYSK